MDEIIPKSSAAALEECEQLRQMLTAGLRALIVSSERQLGIHDFEWAMNKLARVQDFLLRSATP